MRLLILAACCLPLVAYGQEFDRIVIDDNFPGAYQVEVADINGDKKPDIVALGGGTCAWYENPTWKKRIITGPDTTPGVITCASADLDGDGKAEVAIGYEFEMNQPKRGKLGLAQQGATPDEPWTFHPLMDVGNIGSIHRLRWGNPWPHDGLPELFVAPIFGPAARAPSFGQQLATLACHTCIRPLPGVERPPLPTLAEFVGERPVIHAIRVLDVDGDGNDDVLSADNLGVSYYRREDMPSHLRAWTSRVLVPGATGDAPQRGCSEVQLGRLRDGRYLLATIEPWHGSIVAAYAETAPKSLEFGPRVVLDDTLDAGHALWVADIDGDKDDEVFAGHRGKDHRVSMYRFDSKAGAWKRTVLDRDIAAQDLRGGDLDGDGTPDVVAVGGATHNVIWYRPRPGPR
jgi:hypothetical protein